MLLAVIWVTGVSLCYLGDNDRLLQDLDGIELAGGLLPAQDHFAECPLTQDLQELKVL